MNEFIFNALCELKKKCDNHIVKSISIEVKYIGIVSKFYLSILLNGVGNEIEYDEVVIEITSTDGFFFNADLSDSSGSVYIVSNDVRDKKDIVIFLEESERQFPLIFKKLLRQ